MGLRAVFGFFVRAPFFALVTIGAMAAARPAAAAPEAVAADQVSAPTGSITGTVTVADTGQPVTDALVTVVGTTLQATTRSAGRFTISNVPVGPVQISVTARGYLDVTMRDIGVSPGAATPVQVNLQPTPNFMEKVQVTASKEPLSIGEVPAQATIIDQSQIDRKADLRLTQAISNVPGLIVSDLLYSFESVMLRGMPRTGNEWTTTLLLIDGVPQTDSRNSARVINLPINDASSIEVVRGPNSALYGRTAVGGSVNVRTADPTADHRATFEGQVGQFDYLKGHVSASGPIQSWGGYYVSWETTRNHGYFKQPFTFQVDQNAIFTKFTFVPDSSSYGSVSFNNVVSNNAVPTSVPIINGVFLFNLDPQFDRFTNVNMPAANYHQNELRTTLNYTRELTKRIQFTEVFGYRAIEYKFETDGDTIGSPFDVAAKTFTMYPFEETPKEDIFYEEVRFSIRPQLGKIENSLLIGGSYEHNTGSVTGGNLIYTDPDTLGWPLNWRNPVIPDRSTWQFFPFGGNHYTLNSTGIFGQYIIYPTRRLLFNVGGRYDRLSLGNTKPGKPSINGTFDAFSPKLSATVKLLKPEAAGGKGGLNAYAVYSKAFLPPRSPNDLAPTDQTTNLQPEKINNYEAGVKGSVLQDKLSFDAAFFHMKRDGIIVQTREGPFFRDSNAGIQTFRGFEAGLTWAPIRELSLYANGAFYHNRFGTFVIQRSGGDTVLTGNRLPIAPDRVYNAGVTMLHRSGWEATLNVKHVGDVAMDLQNTFTLPAYTVADASLSWKRGLVRLTLAAHNLFDEKYFTYGDISTAESADPAAPRQVVFVTSVTFK
jgi:outer membrane receptor protein involved in Fe transport